ncbi:MAG: tetratricopeptide repeat protein [Planctomycetaceae bacterium]|nr:tetratricopeptide repeat protein [Planctomycetaceae bacterium]
MFLRGICLCAALAAIAPAAWAQAPAQIQVPGNPALDPLRKQADEAYRQRNFGLTMQLAEQILQQEPEDHVALYLRGSARIEVGIATNAAELIRLGIADSREAIRHEGSGLPDYYLPYIYGMSYLTGMEGKKTHAQTARQVADSVLEREDLADDERANLLYQRAHAEVQLKDFPTAEADLQQALQLDPNHEAAHMLQAEIAAKTKSPQEAVNAYSRVIQVFPQDPVVYNNRGMYLLGIKQYQYAVNDFTKAIELNPKFTEAHINRGFCLMEAGDWKTAEGSLNSALAIEPNHTGALSLRGQCRMQQGRTAEGLQDFNQIVQAAPTSASSYADLGFAQFFAGEYVGANMSFAKAMELDPNARFLLPWRLAAEVRCGTITQELYKASLTKAEAERDWVDHIILYQGGRIDETGLLAAVHPNDDAAKVAQTCEAYYFIGLEMTRRNRAADARGYFQRAAQSKVSKLSAYRGALLALNTAN